MEITLQVDKDETASIMLLDVPAAIEEGQPKKSTCAMISCVFWSDMVKLYLSSRISKRVWNFCSRTRDFTQPFFSLFISPVSLKNCSWLHLVKVGRGSLPGCRWPPGCHYILSMGFQPKPSFATRSSEGATPKENLSQPLCWDWKCWDGSWVHPESSPWFW